MIGSILVNKLRFRFNPAKFVNAVAYLAHACPKSTKMTVCKLLYFADKEHLLKYGRPITGDTYYHLEHGQIPTRGLDMLRLRSDAASNALTEKYVTVIGNYVHPRRPVDKKVFSKSDIETLELIVREFGGMTAAQLRKRAHDELTYVESQEGCPIDFSLFFKDRPKAKRALDLAGREQEARDVLLPYGIAE